MNIYKNKMVSRFGLMHMIATNICNWLSVLILETEHSIIRIHHGEWNQTSHLSSDSHHFDKRDTSKYSLVVA